MLVGDGRWKGMSMMVCENVKVQLHSESFGENLSTWIG
jgi:hypothetical protein